MKVSSTPPLETSPPEPVSLPRNGGKPSVMLQRRFRPTFALMATNFPDPKQDLSGGRAAYTPSFSREPPARGTVWWYSSSSAVSSALIAPLRSTSEYVRHDSLARAEVVCAVPLEAAQALEVSNQTQVAYQEQPRNHRCDGSVVLPTRLA